MSANLEAAAKAEAARAEGSITQAAEAELQRLASEIEEGSQLAACYLAPVDNFFFPDTEEKVLTARARYNTHTCAHTQAYVLSKLSRHARQRAHVRVRMRLLLSGLPYADRVQ